MNLTFKKVETEKFYSIIMSVATHLIKTGIYPTYYEMLVTSPTKDELFYKFVLNAYIEDKLCYTSEGGFRNNTKEVGDYLELETIVAKQCEIPLRIIFPNV
jgi:hypothetical protein